MLRADHCGIDAGLTGQRDCAGAGFRRRRDTHRSATARRWSHRGGVAGSRRGWLGRAVATAGRLRPGERPVNRWLHSSELTFETGHALRISARPLRDGRIEFALYQRSATSGAIASYRDPGSSRPPWRLAAGSTAAACTWMASRSTASSRVASAPSRPGGIMAAGCAATRRSSAGARTSWGDNSEGQAAAPSGTFLAVSAGLDHTCALHSDGAIECWGDDHRGQTDAPKAHSAPSPRAPCTHAGYATIARSNVGAPMT